ncbi:hypothetical protein TREMEDRAFT_63340 [Tremella mesenterica DSM 1558]|uniref:uncharacterized protein n=1 Tax=Tremella mesenterica (strain ATCC 24925 / CBS 8224 / DSM 1558 / NBRC 9311 / NRRL Y-6157 / RJB 2259-6 / UBC 559-6) TaxID=578456 RepID=UPI0003F4A156|nr:uncharacterized protein TREMEDRAFT_63340 [Tremella mesenterica DSM 1558]EIW68170.1 hypothetical protein TREMEDRAFT_63340 [Tremella mesenterica DSM 1558]
MTESRNMTAFIYGSESLKRSAIEERESQVIKKMISELKSDSLGKDGFHMGIARQHWIYYFENDRPEGYLDPLLSRSEKEHHFQEVPRTSTRQTTFSYRCKMVVQRYEAPFPSGLTAQYLSLFRGRSSWQGITSRVLEGPRGTSGCTISETL